MGAANTAEKVGQVFLLIVGISTVLLVGVTLTMIYFAVRYSRKRARTVENIHSNLTLELVWTIIPILIVMMMFWQGLQGYNMMRRGPRGSLEVLATGRMWSWTFRYPNGIETADMRLPVGEPVKIKTQSQDVLHSFYVPAFRIKQDAVPQRTNHIWVTPQKVGVYDILCTEYCGTRHSYMVAKLHVVPKDDFDKWYAANKPAPVAAASAARPGEQTKPPGPGNQPPQPTAEPDTLAKAPEAIPDIAESPAAETDASKTASPAASASGASAMSLVARGEMLAKTKGCISCHSLDGSVVVGPSWKGVYGHTITVQRDGNDVQVKVDDAYLKRAILEPNLEVVKNFQPIMPAQDFTDQEIQAFIAFIKSLK